MSDDVEPSVARILAFVMIDGMKVEATNEEKSLRLSTCSFSNAQIADILGIPIGSVNQNLYAARKKLKAPAKKLPATKTRAKKPQAKKLAAKKNGP